MYTSVYAYMPRENWLACYGSKMLPTTSNLLPDRRSMQGCATYLAKLVLVH